MARSTSRAITGAFVFFHTFGAHAGSARSIATDRVEFVVSATAYGSVTWFVSTFPVVGA